MPDMPKNFEISVLLDYYGSMLTEKQREVVEWYYNEDLSLAEIADHAGITRQGVRDSIKRAEIQLIYCEEKLRLKDRFTKTRETLDEIVRETLCLMEESRRLHGSQALLVRMQRIIDLTDEVDT